MTGKKIVGIIVARQGSSRLPGKALVPILGRPVIDLLAERLRISKYIDQVIIATSHLPEDDAIERFGLEKLIPVFRGHPDDVLDRIFHAAQAYHADAVVEVGGDCPLLDGAQLDIGIEKALACRAEVVSNALQAPFTMPIGYEFVWITFQALQKVHSMAVLQSERYQPLQYILRNPGKFSLHSFFGEKDLNHLRWTMDYPEDLDFVKAIFENLYPSNPQFGMNQILKLLEEKPEIALLNQKYVEKVQVSPAWFTGSYVKELHNDILQILTDAGKAEQANEFEKVIPLYERLGGFVNELKLRAETKLNGAKNS